MKQFKRSDRLAEQIRRLVSTILEHELAELGLGMLTFTSVKMTDKLRQARVYYSFLGSEENRERLQGYLTAKRKRIRSQVGQELYIKHIPELEFMFDPSVEQGLRIEQLLNEIKDDSNDDKSEKNEP